MTEHKLSSLSDYFMHKYTQYSKYKLCIKKMLDFFLCFRSYFILTCTSFSSLPSCLSYWILNSLRAEAVSL